MKSDHKKLIEKPSGPAGLDEKDIIKGLQKGGCPVCNYMEDVLFDFFAGWQYALTTDENVQREYAADLGFCPAHTWQLSTVASTIGLSNGYPKLLMHIAEEITKLNGSLPNISNGLTALLKNTDNCRVCLLLYETEEMFTRSLSIFFEQDSAHVTYARSHGMCLRHLSILISLLTSREVVQFLLMETVKHLRETAEGMRRYVLKHEGLERQLIHRDEKYAYLRALIHVAGARNVCAPHIMRI